MLPRATPLYALLAARPTHQQAENLSHTDKARRYLEEAMDHLRMVLAGLRGHRALEDAEMELWRAYSKAEFALFVLSIYDEEKRWAVKEKIDEGASSIRLLEEAEQLLREASGASDPRSQQSLAKIWKAETRMIHVRKILEKEEQPRKS